MNINDTISKYLGVSIGQIEGIVSLLDEGATVPFISRYRKERTFGADEVLITNIKDELERLRELQKRKAYILKSIEEQGKLSEQLKQKIEAIVDAHELEDVYLPFKPRRRSRATIARERGLEPLAKIIFSQGRDDIENLTRRYITGEVSSQKDAIDGACDIIAEWISESERVRSGLRKRFKRKCHIKSSLVKGKEQEGVKYSDYFNFDGVLSREPSHRILALFRAEREGIIKLSIDMDRDEMLDMIYPMVVKPWAKKESAEIVESAMEDSYKRLIKPSLDNEMIAQARKDADASAITIFAENLRQLLLSSPLGSKRVLAIDPGFRSGCKVVCLNHRGELLHNENIYPHAPQKETSAAIKKLSVMVESYKIDVVVIGDGTASRETEQLLKNISFPRAIEVYVVSEDGASVYSASAAAREEFPEYDVTVRGAISIGRRAMDPLAELVKIEPKSIGVGQYQHDVDQGALKKSLDQVVESCVNKVGVNLNSASYHLLSYVSGIGAVLSKNIVEYRAVSGDFKERRELLNVPRLGAKVYEQCAGFLRIKDGSNPLDNSAVHPESYAIVDRMAKDVGCSTTELLASKELRAKIDSARYISDKVGLPTIMDILSELDKPGLDPRGAASEFEFAEGVEKIGDLREGMELPGVVTNITSFGAFVDVGVKQDGLVHISQLADRYVSNPNDVVKLRQQVKVRVVKIDLERNRLELTMKL